ncbi:MAG TPA: glycosyltransferase [Pyrinomonadaceae bacterium]|nr:glycosyltransferase [Pyrinomonadaceae bacterium]
MSETSNEIELTVVLTVVSGKDAMRACLGGVYPQIDFAAAEVIVPYDKWSADVGDLAAEFPEVEFHFIDDLGMASDTAIAAHTHRLYDRRRAIGLRHARGKIIAMTEDHAVPAADWIEQIFAAHEQPYDVIGGAIENGTDKPLNWAWYYCDFGRYGRPFLGGILDYVSDVNVSYKKPALDAVKHIWNDAYRETILHWGMRERGSELYLDPRLVVYQQRPKMTLANAFSERVQWGRVFAETRVAVCSFRQRVIYAAGALALPPVLLLRAFSNMRRQKRSFQQIAASAPIAFLLLVGWSFGELLGYLFGMPEMKSAELEAANT